MKTNFVLSGAKSYSAPAVVRMDVQVEKGFAFSSVSGAGTIPDLEFDE